VDGKWLIVFCSCITGCGVNVVNLDLVNLRPGERLAVMGSTEGVRMQTHRNPKLKAYLKAGRIIFQTDPYQRLAIKVNAVWPGRWVRLANGRIIQLQQKPWEPS
jgi:uncharacterized lipoprotein YmbA